MSQPIDQSIGAIAAYAVRDRLKQINDNHTQFTLTSLSPFLCYHTSGQDEQGRRGGHLPVLAQQHVPPLRRHAQLLQQEQRRECRALLNQEEEVRAGARGNVTAC